MNDDAENLDAPDETPSEGAPAEDAETTSATPEAEAEAEAEGQDEDEPKEPERDPAWVNLEKKFAHIKDPQERQDAIAAAYWEKTNYASKIRKENEALKRQLAKIDQQAPRTTAPEKAKEDAPPAPPPEIRELDSRLKGLYDEDQTLIKESDSQLQDLNSVSTEIAKCTARIEDAKEASDEQKLIRNEAKLAALEARKEAIVRAYRATQRERLTLGREYERLGKERLWMEKALGDRQSRQAKEEQESEEFRQEFPDEVDNLIENAAQKLQIPESYLEELREEVTDGLLVDLWRLGEANLDEVDVPGLVRGRVQKFMELRNIAARRKFAETSKAKLSVSSTARPAAPGSKPATRKGPVTPESMNRGERPSKMQQARDYLIGKGF